MSQSSEEPTQLPAEFRADFKGRIFDFRLHLPSVGRVLQEMALDLASSAPEILPLTSDVLSGFQRAINGLEHQEKIDLHNVTESIYVRIPLEVNKDSGGSE